MSSFMCLVRSMESVVPTGQLTGSVLLVLWRTAHLCRLSNFSVVRMRCATGRLESHTDLKGAAANPWFSQVPTHGERDAPCPGSIGQSSTRPFSAEQSSVKRQLSNVKCQMTIVARLSLAELARLSRNLVGWYGGEALE